MTDPLISLKKIGNTKRCNGSNGKAENLGLNSHGFNPLPKQDKFKKFECF